MTTSFFHKRPSTKILALLLSAVIFASCFITNITPHAFAANRTRPSDQFIKSRIDELSGWLVGRYFNQNQDTSCGVKSSGHGCSYCDTTNIVKQQWFQSHFSKTITSSQFYSTGRSCVGFAWFAQWYVFRANDSDRVSRDVIGSCSNKSDIKNFIVSTAQIGDYIWVNGHHAIMFISSNDQGIVFLDCNGTGNYNCLVSKRTYTWDSISSATISRSYSVSGDYSNIDMPVVPSNPLSINPTVYPSGTLTQGEKFNLEGTVTSDHSITYFEGVVYDSAHNAYMAASCAPNSYSVNIYSSNVNLSLPFRTLKTGSYYLVYNAVDSSGATASWNSGWFRVAGGSDLPSQPTVTTAQSSYNYGDSVRITWNAVAGNSFYWINVYKDGSLIVNQDMGQDTAYTLQNAGVGSYTVYVSANNSAGSSGSGSCTFRVTSQNDTITINNYNYPTDMTIGDSFSVKGVVKSTFSNISSLTVAVYSSDGSMEIGTNYAPNTASADISSIAGKLNFAKLSIGTHYYRITATNATQTQQLVNREFQVKYKIVSTDSDELRLRDFANLLSSYYQSDYFKNYSIDGSFQSNNSLITEVGVELFDQNGNLLQSAKDYPLVNYYRLNNLGSNALRPERLAIGTYKYNVYAVNAKGQKAQKSREIKVLPIPETIPYIETNTDVIELDTKYNCVFELECFARGVDYSWDYSLWADPLLIGSPLSEVQWAHTEQGCRLRVSAWNKKAGEGVVLARLYDRKEEAVIAVRYIKTITHEYEETVISPTCTTEGYTLLRCTACGKEEKINFVEALGHDWETNSVVTPPTCTESGYTTFTCANCGGSYVDDYVDPLGHAFDAWEQTLAPTCTTYGIEESRCSRCNLAVEREIDLLGHDWSAPVYAWSADCLQVTACRTCKRDATHIEAETVNTTSEITKPATETAEGEITYTAVFENPAFATQTKTVAIPKLEPQSHPADEYPDVEQGSWYYAAADYIISAGYMGSTSQTEKTFEPYTKVSRSMVASILYRIAGSPADVEYKGTFTDVPKDQWFTTAIEWCAQNGLASGKGDGRFDPNGNVTRQELAVFMYKLADYLEKDTEAAADLTAFPDGSTVPDWAAPYLKWAVSAGLITGKGQTDGTTLLAPVDTAMRCELASILQRFLNK